MWEKVEEFSMQTLVVGSGLNANSNLLCAGKFIAKPICFSSTRKNICLTLSSRHRGTEATMTVMALVVIVT